MSTQNRTPSAIDAIAEEYCVAQFTLVPELAAEMGVSGYGDEYHDHSPAGLEALAELDRRTLAQLAQEKPVDDVDAVTLAAMTDRLQLAVDLAESGWGLADLNNIASPAQSVRMVFDLMPQNSDEDWAAIARRLSHVSEALAGYQASLEAAAANGKVAAARQVKKVIEQTRAYAKDGDFFDSLIDLAAQSSTEETVEQIRLGAHNAKAAYSSLADFLETTLLPQAPTEDAVGRERYALASRSFVGATIDLDETYAWGIEELDRIIAEQKDVAERIQPGASIDEAKALLDADPKRQLHGAEALREWMQSLADSAVANLADTHFEITGPMRTIECMIAPTHEGAIYYTGPSDDFSRPGRMWWSLPEGETTFTTWNETSTVYHEGVPGHHLQLGTAVAQSETLNMWRRNFCWSSGHGEGWALYAERLMEELGYLDDLGDKMGMLDGQRMRAARVVFDIGVHLKLDIPARWEETVGASGPWTAEAGRRFLAANLSISEGQLDFEFNRYLGWPGQAPSYKVGERIWEQIRATLEEREGSHFNLKEFHTRALRLGGLPLQTLEDVLLG